MAIRKLKYNDTYIYVEDDIDYKETGIVIDEEEDLSKTKRVEVIKEEDLDNTMTNVLGEENEE